MHRVKKVYEPGAHARGRIVADSELRASAALPCPSALHPRLRTGDPGPTTERASAGPLRARRIVHVGGMLLGAVIHPDLRSRRENLATSRLLRTYTPAPRNSLVRFRALRPA